MAKIQMMQIRFSRLKMLALSMLFIAATGDYVKNMLIIGDSISIVDTPYIQKTLAPGINVEHNPGNGGSTKRGVENIEKWVGGSEWDIILFNFGMYDMAHKDSLNKLV